VLLGELRMGTSLRWRGQPYSERTPCKHHTTEWLENEIEEMLASVISDEDWPSILAARKIEALRAQEYMERKAQERQLAQQAGEGEWRRANGTWKVWTLCQPKAGDTVIVRSRYGEAKNVIIDSSHETASGWLSETHLAPVSEAPRPHAVTQETA
jgi:hypothetical protein